MDAIKLLQKEELDSMCCSTPGCRCSDSVLFLKGRCHPESPTFTSYDKAGFISVDCATCGKNVARVAIHAAPEVKEEETCKH